MNFKYYINTWLRRLQIVGIPIERPRILRVFGHDPKAFTQGLAYAEGKLFESTGTLEASSLRRLCPESGAVLEVVAVKNDFAEGIAYANNRIYQLTWTSGRVLIYDLNPIHLVAEAQINHDGWGLGAYNNGLISTDGSHRIRHFDLDFKLTKTIAARRLGLPLRHLNAFTTVKDQAFINIWYTPLIAQVELPNGRLVRIIDCTELEKIESPKTPHHIFNGIAFVPTRDSFFTTGKNWQKMFEIRFNTSKMKDLQK